MKWIGKKASREKSLNDNFDRRACTDWRKEVEKKRRGSRLKLKSYCACTCLEVLLKSRGVVALLALLSKQTFMYVCTYVHARVTLKELECLLLLSLLLLLLLLLLFSLSLAPLLLLLPLALLVFPFILFSSWFKAFRRSLTLLGSTYNYHATSEATRKTGSECAPVHVPTT